MKNSCVVMSMVSEEELRKVVEECGYRLRKVVRFKYRDRFVVEKPGRFTATLYLNTKIENLTPDDVRRILCVGKRNA